mgnify:CR=1 FL=1
MIGWHGRAATSTTLWNHTRKQEEEENNVKEKRREEKRRERRRSYGALSSREQATFRSSHQAERSSHHYAGFDAQLHFLLLDSSSGTLYLTPPSSFEILASWSWIIHTHTHFQSILFSPAPSFLRLSLSLQFYPFCRFFFLIRL